LSNIRIQMALDMANSPSGSLHVPAKLYVGNLPDRFTSKDLEDEFNRFGVILDCHVHGREQPNKANSHYGYITFDQEAGAEAALKKMRGRMIARKHRRPAGPLKVYNLSAESAIKLERTRSFTKSSSTKSSPPTSPCNTNGDSTIPLQKTISSHTSDSTESLQSITQSKITTKINSTSISKPVESASIEPIKTINIETIHSCNPTTPSTSTSKTISFLAHVEEGAQISDGVTIGPFSHIHATATIGSNTTIGSHCSISGCIGSNNIIGNYIEITNNVTIGHNNELISNVVIGKRAEDYVQRHKRPTGRVFIGNNNIIREFVTIHSPEGERGHDLDGTTKISNNCYIMRGSHVGHDNILNNFVTLSCNTTLAGYVRIGRNTNIGIGCNVHQFTTIGNDVIVGMGSNVLYDVPPYTMFTSRLVTNDDSNNPGLIEQLNVIGMMRSGIKDDDIDQLENWYRDYYRTTNVKCFLSCNNSEWFQNDMKRFLENKLKQNRSRPLSKVAELTPMHEANSVM